MATVLDFDGEELKTNTLYGVSHANCPEEWMMHDADVNQISSNRYAFFDWGRGKGEHPKYAFKIHSRDSNNTNESISVDDGSDKRYYLEDYTWDEEQRKYVISQKPLAETDTTGMLGYRKYLINGRDEDNSSLHFSNSEDSNKYVKIGAKGSTIFWTYYMAKEVEDEFMPQVRAVKYYPAREESNEGPPTDPIERAVYENPELRKEAEKFIFKNLDDYLNKKSFIARIGEEYGVLEFWKTNDVLEAKVIKNGHLSINPNSSNYWNVYVDGRSVHSFVETTYTVSEIVEEINRRKFKGNNFVVTDQNEKEIYRFTGYNIGDNTPGTIEFYQLGNTLIVNITGAYIRAEIGVPNWYVYVNGVSQGPEQDVEVSMKSFRAFTSTMWSWEVRDFINQSTDFKGESFIISTKGSYDIAANEVMLHLYDKFSMFQELRKGVTAEDIMRARWAARFMKEESLQTTVSQLIERAEMLYDGDKLKIKVKTNGRTLEDSILIGLNHIAKKFIAVDLQNSAGQSTSPRQADTHYSFTLYEEGTKNILKTVSVQKGENIDGFIKEINKMYFLYGDIVKFYHSDGYNESILDVYNDNIKESERFARIRYFIVTEKGFQGIFHIKNWETTSYYVDGITFSEVPQGKKMKYRVVLNGNDIGTSYPYQTNGKGTDTILFTQDYYDMDGWGVSKYDNHIVVFAIDPDTGLEYEIAHHEPSQTRGDLEIPEECRHHNIQVNFYNSTCNIYLSKKR
ncbi:hypothetical protein P4G97_27620 [Bacillus cereus]|nr:hypothetical protein [Bacillus cereus]MEB9434995.1 hypothetical protein [Bacillus cereus]